MKSMIVALVKEVSTASESLRSTFIENRLQANM